MLSKTRGIVLHTIPYNDKYAIIYIYTESYGRVSYLISSNRGKRSTVAKTLFMPLSVLELEVDHQNKRDLQRIKESKCCQSLYSLSTNPVKNVVALFISEVLYRVLKETEPNPRLFSYLCKSIDLLEQTKEGIANYHIVFLMGLLHYLGVFPHVETYQNNYYFDMQNGVFTDRIPMHKHYLNQPESAVFSSLLRISYENMSLYSFSRHDRVLIVHRILDYYRLHLPEFPEIKSLAVLQSLFD
jgi:DNA repair protein RecO (recombination protein O)